MKAIVFGGSGFLGSHCADALVYKGHQVKIFDVKESPYLIPGQEMITGNILDEDADVAVLEIRDAGGRLVKLEDLGSQGLGSHELTWDGKDMMGVDVDDGAYTFDIKAYTAGGQEVGVDYRAVGKVTGVDYASGTALLVLDHHVSAEVGAVLGVI